MITPSDVATMTDTQKTEHIRKTVLSAGQELRQRHPWLRHQNVIGATIMIVSVLGMIGSGWLYVADLIPWWLCVPVTAIFASFIHELEHDLIHLMYFKNRPWINNLMLAVGWVARASTINPFVRRKLHLHHHKFSGTESDLEERGITNGERWGLRRFLMTGDNMLAVVMRPFEMIRANRAYIRSQKPKDRAEVRRLSLVQLTSYLPIGNLYYLAFHTWVVANTVLIGAELLGQPIALSAPLADALAVLNVAAVVYMLPSLLRTFCLHFISSNMHYYGDVEARNVMQQCQVLNPWWLMPMQLFCFNFGSTHAIHHFAVREPFYIRQWTAPTAHKVMRDMGVRFNDFGTFRRANRFFEAVRS
ncbi:fatty acid desaturase [Marinobacter sp. SS21]|uniref:fatty acid desaturase n=1 Tax=Marinobacter sp. SS21 TaxID=2979460 RepID=UPI00232BE607|nr:fatty acid desaturase [Marinobacter sp. SS21]MDC0661270.1 fatty acid desaturase [Marinobacter sp. SS21]